MGGFSPQIQSPQSPPSGKGTGISANPQQSGQNKEVSDFFAGLTGGKVTVPGQQGQPELGMPNAYSNTVQPWDNQQTPQPSTGKGNLLSNQFAQNTTGKGV